MKKLLLVFILILSGLEAYAFPPYYVFSHSKETEDPPGNASKRIVKYFDVEYTFGNPVGTLKYGEILEFDITGKLISKYNYDAEDQTGYQYVYIYDEQGRIVEERLVGSEDKYFKTREFIYNLDTLTEISYSLDGPYQKDITKFDDQRRETEKTCYDSDGKIVNIFTKEYFPLLRIEKAYDSSGALTSINKYYFSTDGKEIKREDYYQDGLSSTITDSYDLYGNQIGWEARDKSGNLTSKSSSTYENGRKVKIEVTNYSANLRFIEEYIYQEGELHIIRHFEEETEMGEKTMKLKYLIAMEYE